MGHHSHAFTDPSFKVRRRTTLEVAGRVARYLRPYPWMAAGTILCALVSQLAGLAYPKLTQYVIDDVLLGGRGDRLAWAVAGLLGAYLVRDGLSSLRILLNNAFEQAVILDMRRDVYARMQRLPAGWFDQRATGDLMTRVIEDVNVMERLVIDGTEQGVVSLVGIVGVMVFMFLANPMLAWVALVPLPVLVAGAWWYTRTAAERYRARSVANSAMNALLTDNLQGVRQVKSFGREAHEDARFRQRAEALRDGTLRVMRAWAWYNPSMTFVGAAGSVAVLWLGAREVLAGRMTQGQLVGFLLFLGMFYQPVSQLRGLNQIAQSARAAGERVFDILDASAEEVDGGPWVWRARGEVRFESVAAGYEGKEVLHDISLAAEPGQMIALVGPTGAGKSTLVNLLPRFHEVTGGRILVDGRDTARMALGELRRQIAVVSQEPFLFNGTVRENLMYGRIDADEAAMEAAAKAANCDEFIRKLAQGYDTRVGERGVRLSVGERQRISIARALLKDAPILILDEATASVDTATERLIQEALERLFSSRTSFVIAHRLSTVRRADRILVLRAGRIEESGRHGELVGAGGLYGRLVRAQEAGEDLEVVPESGVGAENRGRPRGGSICV
ncbi:MAG: ABC transporter ATP-binding protein [Verrucomicrobia bacterium]|nr:MAG: ABC transporter ATP-binding protein [Verrucomicrobiota bacterium]